MTVKIAIEQKIPLYQKLAPKIKELNALGIPNREIAEKIKISRKTIKKELS